MVTRQPGSPEHVDAQAYRRLFNLAPIGIVIVEPSANPVIILENSRQAALMYGYAAGELTGMPVRNRESPDEGQRFLMLAGCREGRATRDTDIRKRQGGFACYRHGAQELTIQTTRKTSVVRRGTMITER